MPMNQNGCTLVFHQSVNRFIDRIANCLCTICLCFTRRSPKFLSNCLSFDQWFIQEVFRPLTVERHTYNNIKEIKYFSINQITETITNNAHQTSAKFENKQSEFESCNIESLHREGCVVPFVKESNIQMLCTYSKEHLLENDCILLTATIERFWVNSASINKSYWLNHEEASSSAIGGLDTYYKVSLIDRYSYAQPNSKPKSILE